MEVFNRNMYSYKIILRHTIRKLNLLIIVQKSECQNLSRLSHAIIRHQARLCICLISNAYERVIRILESGDYDDTFLYFCLLKIQLNLMANTLYCIIKNLRRSILHVENFDNNLKFLEFKKYIARRK